jgi:hypothetical protein
MMREALMRSAVRKRPFTLLAFVVAVVVWTATVCDAAAAAGKNSNGRQSGGAYYDRSLSDPVSTSMRTQPASERNEIKRNPKPRPPFSHGVDEQHSLIAVLVDSRINMLQWSADRRVIQEKLSYYLRYRNDVRYVFARIGWFEHKDRIVLTLLAAWNYLAHGVA